MNSTIETQPLVSKTGINIKPLNKLPQIKSSLINKQIIDLNVEEIEEKTFRNAEQPIKITINSPKKYVTSDSSGRYEGGTEGKGDEESSS